MINWPSREGELRAEIDRLREEVATAQILIGEHGAEIDRLRAEIAELREAAQSLVSEIRVTGTHGSWKYLAEILAKTAKGGE